MCVRGVSLCACMSVCVPVYVCPRGVCICVCRAGVCAHARACVCVCVCAPCGVPPVARQRYSVNCKKSPMYKMVLYTMLNAKSYA